MGLLVCSHGHHYQDASETAVFPQLQEHVRAQNVWYPSAPAGHWVLTSYLGEGGGERVVDDNAVDAVGNPWWFIKSVCSPRPLSSAFSYQGLLCGNHSIKNSVRRRWLVCTFVLPFLLFACLRPTIFLCWAGKARGKLVYQLILYVFIFTN